MDQRGNHRIEVAEGCQRDARCVYCQGPRKVGYDDAIALAGNLEHFDNSQHVISQKKNVGDFACDLSFSPEVIVIQPQRGSSGGRRLLIKQSSWSRSICRTDPAWFHKTS